MREKAGLVPGATLTIGLDDDGQVVVRPGDEASAARRDRFQSRLERSLEGGIVRDPARDDPSA